jgi:putative FmdB family regulatory protein
MPTYVYKCIDCEQVTEAVQKFQDDPLKICPQCEGELKKVFSAAPVVFRGSGFYSTGG